MVLSVSESTFLAVPGAGILLGGVITALAGPRIALGIAAGGTSAVAGLMWLRLPSVVPAPVEEPPARSREIGLAPAARQR